MSGYNNYVGKIAENLQSSNMQKHMGSLNNDISQERQDFLQNIINYEYHSFIRLIFDAAIEGRYQTHDGIALNNNLLENERDLVPIFTKINEDCLNDPAFSKAIVNKEQYTKLLDSERDYFLFYPPEKAWSVTHDIVMNFLYLPSISNEQPNAFRIDVQEKLEEDSEYPYLSISVDVMDDGNIRYNECVKVNKENVERFPISEAHISFDEEGVNVVRDVLMNLFEKTGIIEESSNKHV